MADHSATVQQRLIAIASAKEPLLDRVRLITHQPEGWRYCYDRPRQFLTRTMLNDQPPSLLEVVPRDLFGPLSSANRDHYWRLLTYLYSRFFGPEADLPPAAGWTRREVLVAIEQIVEHDDPWESEGEEDQSESPDQRATYYLRRLIGAGWIVEEEVGLAVIVSMPPVVGRLMETLIAFIDQAISPPEAGAKMRSIEATLQRIATSTQPGADLDEAASQARQLVGAMSAMGLRVREVMKDLTAEVTTAQALRKIFEEYISKTYIADYAELTGPDHPLARKSAVVALANEIALGQQRERLITWYSQHRTHGNTTLAEDRFFRTIKRIKDLNRIQDYLSRLDDDLRRMNRRMLALIDYRLHAPSHLEARIKKAIVGVKAAAEQVEITPPIGPGQMLSGELLFKPRVRRPSIPVESDAHRTLTPEQEARKRLRDRARDARRVQSADIHRYLSRVMGERLQIRASEMPIESIKDFRVIQTLSSLAIGSIAANAGTRKSGVSGRLPRYSFSAATDHHVKNRYFEMSDFYVTKVK